MLNIPEAAKRALKHMPTLCKNYTENYRNLLAASWAVDTNGAREVRRTQISLVLAEMRRQSRSTVRPKGKRSSAMSRTKQVELLRLVPDFQKCLTSNSKVSMPKYTDQELLWQADEFLKIGLGAKSISAEELVTCLRKQWAQRAADTKKKNIDRAARIAHEAEERSRQLELF